MDVGNVLAAFITAAGSIAVVHFPLAKRRADLIEKYIGCIKAADGVDGMEDTVETLRGLAEACVKDEQERAAFIRQLRGMQATCIALAVVLIFGLSTILEALIEGSALFEAVEPVLVAAGLTVAVAVAVDVAIGRAGGLLGKALQKPAGAKTPDHEEGHASKRDN